MLRNINMKMCRISLANILNVTEIRDVVEMTEFRRICQATREISDCAPAAIKRYKKAISMLYGISSKRHISKILLLFVGAEITFGARFKKDIIQIAEVI
jgi:hypothetical protein